MPLSGMFALSVLLIVSGSFSVWAAVASRLWQRQPILERLPGHARTPPIWAVTAAVGWIGFNLLNRILLDLSDKPLEPQTAAVGVAFVVSLAALAVLATLLFVGGDYGLKDIGIFPAGWWSSLEIGGLGFLASVLPTFLLLVATFPLRSTETQHPLLQILGREPAWETVLLLVLTAVVVAPISEELLFRVTLQSVLTNRCGSLVSVPVVAILFSAVHGWRDGLALLPLAAILGYIYDRRRDFVAVSLVHALFNATNLFLAASS